MKYRPHRGILSDSMAEMVELANLQALRDHVCDQGAVIKPYSETPDERIGWPKTCMVLDSEGYPLGFTDAGA